MRAFLKGVLFCALFTLPCFASSFILNDDGVLNKPLIKKLDEIGGELYKKSKIKLMVAVSKEKTLNQLKDMMNQEKGKVILIALSIKSHKVDIFASEKSLFKLFNKADVLSPFPNTGSILPLLASHKGKDIYNAAILNGYADVSDRLSKNLHIKLKDAIGDANRITLNIILYIFYAIILLALCAIIYRKFRKKYA